MAQVTTQGRPELERQLSWALWQWARLPEVEAEIDGWDVLDQQLFVEEWPLEEERLLWLERYAAEGTLTVEQRARYEELRRLVERNRPIIRRLQQT